MSSRILMTKENISSKLKQETTSALENLLTWSPLLLQIFQELAMSRSLKLPQTVLSHFLGTRLLTMEACSYKDTEFI